MMNTKHKKFSTRARLCLVCISSTVGATLQGLQINSSIPDLNARSRIACSPCPPVSPSAIHWKKHNKLNRSEEISHKRALPGQSCVSFAFPVQSAPPFKASGFLALLLSCNPVPESHVPQVLHVVQLQFTRKYTIKFNRIA